MGACAPAAHFDVPVTFLYAILSIYSLTCGELYCNYLFRHLLACGEFCYFNFIWGLDF